MDAWVYSQTGIWEALWKRIADMHELRELHVKLVQDRWRDLSRSRSPAWESKVFAPMILIQGVEDYEVQVNWNGDFTCDRPLRLKRVS